MLSRTAPVRTRKAARTRPGKKFKNLNGPSQAEKI